MIDLNEEQLIALADVPAILPKRRSGKRIHLSCVYRWAQRGLRGIRLETLQCGGTKVTSKKALARFFQQLDESPPQRTESRTSRSRRRQMDIERADRENTAAGL